MNENGVANMHSPVPSSESGALLRNVIAFGQGMDHENTMSIVNHNARPIRSLLVIMTLCLGPAAIIQAGASKVYSGSSGYTVVARIDGEKIYWGSSGYKVAGRIDGDKVYHGSTGYKIAGRIDGSKLYAGSSGYKVLARVDGDKVYQGSSGYKVILRGDGAGRRELLAVAALR